MPVLLNDRHWTLDRNLLLPGVEIRLPTSVLADSGSKSFLISVRISATVVAPLSLSKILDAKE